MRDDESEEKDCKENKFEWWNVYAFIAQSIVKFTIQFNVCFEVYQLSSLIYKLLNY